MGVEVLASNLSGSCVISPIYIYIYLHTYIHLVYAGTRQCFGWLCDAHKPL